MPPKRYDPTPPWTHWEPVLRGDDGHLDGNRRPFSEQFSGEVGGVVAATGKMWLMGYHGWPGAIAAIRDDQGKPLIEEADNQEPKIWILKCKPHCWRLYFYVYQDKNRFLYLYAKCKKKWKRNTSDSKRARNLFARIGGTRGIGIDSFAFPQR
jgi:hypothetical protein